MNVEEVRPLTYVGSFVEGCLERIGEDDLEGGNLTGRVGEWGS
jgi:hypothetical protein